MADEKLHETVDALMDATKALAQQIERVAASAGPAQLENYATAVNQLAEAQAWLRVPRRYGSN